MKNSLRDTQKKLKQSNKELQEFAYIASHDMQEPLRKVSIFGNNLYQELHERLTNEERDQFDRLLKATARMQAMIKDLLELSRINTQGKPFVEVNLGEVIQNVLADLEVPIEKLGGKIHVGRLPIVKADPSQMERLFINLIGNSLKYHCPDESPNISISAKKCKLDGQKGTEIFVKDNGIGFEMEHAESIFQPFHRLNGRSQYEGTGMGLAISKRIVEHHGGKILAESQPGKGAIFKIIFPQVS